MIIKKIEAKLFGTGKLFFAFAFGIFLVTVFAGCSGGGNTAGDSGGNGQGSASTSNGDMSSMGQTPDSSWHSSYLVGSHSTFVCSTCHTSPTRSASMKSVIKINSKEVANSEICYICHASDYSNSVFNHDSRNTGVYCNSCHFSDSFKSHNRINQTQWHNEITTSCLTCHGDKTPAMHQSDGRTSNCESCHSYSSGWSGASGATSGGAHSTANCSNCHLNKMPANHFGVTCENCHQYPSWSAANTEFTHSGVLSGCRSCHPGHFLGYDCEWCHTYGISWGYKHSRNKSQACSACHSYGGSGDDDENEGEGDDDGDTHND